MPDPSFTTTVLQQFLALLHDGDFWSLLMASVLLLFVGLRLTAKRPRLERVAQAAGVVAFLAVIIADFRETGFPIPDSLPGLLFQALLGGGFTFAVCTVALPVLALAWDWTFAIPFRAVTANLRQARLRRRRREQEVQDSIERHRQRELQAIDDARRREQEFEAAQQRQLLERQWADDEQRRQHARFCVQVTFDQHRDRLIEVFPETVLKGYFAQYMNESEPPDSVEQRGNDLQQMFDAWLKRSGASDPQQFESIADIVNSFHRQQQELREAFVSLDVPHKETIINTLCVRLQKMQDRAIQEFLK